MVVVVNHGRADGGESKVVLKRSCRIYDLVIDIEGVEVEWNLRVGGLRGVVVGLVGLLRLVQRIAVEACFCVGIVRYHDAV